MSFVSNNRSFRVSNIFFDFFSSFFWDAGLLKLKNSLFFYDCVISFVTKNAPILIKYKGSRMSFWSTFSKSSARSSFINFFYKIIFNTISDLFYKSFCKIKLSGVGYKISFINGSNNVYLDLGYSHKVSVVIPGTISVFSTSKSKYQTFYLFGLNRNLVKSFYSFLSSLKKFDAYKGKGLYLVDTVLQLKKGKKKK